MSNAPQNQNPSTQNQAAKNAPAANTDKVGNNIKKDAPTASKPAMKEGDSCSTSGKPAAKTA